MLSAKMPRAFHSLPRRLLSQYELDGRPATTGRADARSPTIKGHRVLYREWRYDGVITAASVNSTT